MTGRRLCLSSFVKERAAYLLELDDLLAQLVLAGLEFGGQTGEAQERTRAAVDQLPRQRDFVVRQRAAAYAALIHRILPTGTDRDGNRARERAD